METLAGVEESDEAQIEQSCDAKDTSPLSSPRLIADPVVYKLVRVEGDGRLVPATDDEVMEVEDLLEDDKGEPPLVADTGQAGICIASNGTPASKDNIESSEAVSQSENAEVDVQKLNARMEYIGVMLEKVKQEERLRVSSGSPDHSSCHLKVDNGCSEQHDSLPESVENPQTDNSVQETAPLSSPRLNERSTTKSENQETTLKPADGAKVRKSSSSATCSSSIPDFSFIKGEICLDSLTIKELHETFKATFGRETSVKDKLWLKRRIAMGLTNSCDVSTTTFIINGNTLVKKRTEAADPGITTHFTDEMDRVNNVSSKDPLSSPTAQVDNRHVVFGKRLRKPEVEHECKSEDLQIEKGSSKRVRKPTKRYIEELSDVDTRECSGKLVSSGKFLDIGRSYQKSLLGPTCNVGADETAVITRPESLGGSGVQVPYVSRVRRGRRRENFMPLMKNNPSSMGRAAKLVKKALGVRASRQDSDAGDRSWRTRLAPEPTKKPIIADEREKEKQDVIKRVDEPNQGLVLENQDLSGDNSDGDVTSLAIAKGETRRKHHRAWTLGEVAKLVEGVSRFGAGKWSEIKRLVFSPHSHRTSVDLKDKWRNLLRASFAQSPADKMRNARKHAAAPIPLPILLRVRELAQKHPQKMPDLPSSGSSAGCSGRGVYETKSGYL